MLNNEIITKGPVTFKRTSNGEFEVYQEGFITKYHIFNSSMGISGFGNNDYSIENIETRQITNVGRLAKAKATVTMWLSK